MSTINTLLLLVVPDADVGSHRSRDNDTDLKRTRTKTGLSLGHGGKSPPLVNNRGSQRTPTIRKISSVDGLTEDEQDKIAAILVSLLFPEASPELLVV